jgi:hypothetical protein
MLVGNSAGAGTQRVRKAQGVRRGAVLQPGSNDLVAAARHVMAFVPGMPAVLGVVGEQGADLAGIIALTVPPIGHSRHRFSPQFWQLLLSGGLLHL